MARAQAYIAPATAATMGIYGLGMILLGTVPNQGMDFLAALGRSFLHGEGPEHPVAYFSAVNLRGAAISIVIGSLVYLLVVRRLLIRRGKYINPIPTWMNLEFGLYRPALRFAAQVAIVLATWWIAFCLASFSAAFPVCSPGPTRGCWPCGTRRSSPLLGRSTPPSQRGAGGG